MLIIFHTKNQIKKTKKKKKMSKKEDGVWNDRKELNNNGKAYYEKDYDDDEEDDLEYQEYLNKKTAPKSRDEQLDRYRRQKNIDKLKKQIRTEANMDQQDDIAEAEVKERFDPLRMFDLQWIRRFPCVNESIIASILPSIVSAYYISKKSVPTNKFRKIIFGSSITYFISLPIIFTVLFHRYDTKAHRVLIGEPDDFNQIYVAEEGIFEPDNYDAVRPMGPDGGMLGDPVKYPKNLRNIKLKFDK